MAQTTHNRAGGCGVAVLILLVLLLTPGPAIPAPPKYFVVNDPRAVVHSGRILVTVGIGVDNVSGLFDMLKDGAAVELTVIARVERVRSLWTNLLLAETEAASPLQHNPLTREFSLYMPGEPSPLLDKNLDRLLQATWEKFVLDLGPAGVLDVPAADYRVELALALRHAKVPPWLEKNLIFWSRNVVDPEKIIIPLSVKDNDHKETSGRN